MNPIPPIVKSKDQLTSIINEISSEHSAVGIDAQHTHAIIIDYLQRITERLDALEAAGINTPSNNE